MFSKRNVHTLTVRPKFTNHKMKSFMVVRAGNAARVNINFEVQYCIIIMQNRMNVHCLIMLFTEVSNLKSKFCNSKLFYVSVLLCILASNKCVKLQCNSNANYTLFKLLNAFIHEFISTHASTDGYTTTEHITLYKV